MSETRTVLITSLALTLWAFRAAAAPTEVLPAEPCASPTNLRQVSDYDVFEPKFGDSCGMPGPKDGTQQLNAAWFVRKTADGGTLAFERDVHGPSLGKTGVQPSKGVDVNHRVVKRKGSARAVVWESVTGYGECIDGMGPRFIFFDAVQRGGDVYVFYSKEHMLTVDKVASGPESPWRVVTSFALTDGYRLFGAGQFYRDRNSGGLGIVYRGESQKESRWLGFEQLRNVNAPWVSSRTDTSVQASTTPNGVISDGSGFSRRLSDPRVFKEELARAIDVGAPVDIGAEKNEHLFARKAVDGSTLTLQRESPFKRVTRIDSRTCEVLEVRYWLLRRIGSEEQKVFLLDVMIYPGIPVRRRFASVFWDAAMVGDEVYVLHSNAFVPKVAVLAKASKAQKALGGANSLDWVVVQTFVLAGLGYEALSQFIRDRDTGQLGVIYKDSAAHEERWIGLDQVRPAPREGHNQ